MNSKIRSRTIKCPTQNRLVEVSYNKTGSWFNPEYNVLSCPAMADWGGCDRQCKPLLAIPARASEWQARY